MNERTEVLVLLKQMGWTPRDDSLKLTELHNNLECA